MILGTTWCGARSTARRPGGICWRAVPWADQREMRRARVADRDLWSDARPRAPVREARPKGSPSYVANQLKGFERPWRKGRGGW